jgi:1-acyl-sn-glycerol-3-phosphate acyltransferase
MIVINLLRTILLYTLTVVTFFIGTTITFLFLPFSRSKSRPFRIAAHYWARILLWASGTRIRVSGLENLPRSGPFILVANHQGAGDIPLLLGCLPVYFRFAIKKELFGLPVFGWYLKLAGYFSVDRQVVLSAYRMVEQIIDSLKEGESVMIFPEGTRSRDGSLGAFKRGSLMAALKAGAPIVPVAIDGSYRFMPRGTWILQPTECTLAVAPPVYIKTEEEYDAKVAEVRAAIAARLPAHR